MIEAVGDPPDESIIPGFLSNLFLFDFSWKYLTEEKYEMSVPIYHIAGTSKMGPELNVIGVDGLRQCDGGVMPAASSGNTNAPIVMIAKRCADSIKTAWNYPTQIDC